MPEKTSSANSSQREQSYVVGFLLRQCQACVIRDEKVEVTHVYQQLLTINIYILGMGNLGFFVKYFEEKGWWDVFLNTE